GATTPIPSHTHKVMAQLGNRILFYEIAGEKWPDEELVKFAKTYGANRTLKKRQKTVNDFIEAHFEKYPINSVERQQIEISDDLRLKVVQYAKLIAHGRVEVKFNEWGNDLEAGTPEGPQRVILLLQTLLQGLALADNRQSVNAEDVEII